MSLMASYAQCDAGTSVNVAAWTGVCAVNSSVVERKIVVMGLFFVYPFFGILARCLSILVFWLEGYRDCGVFRDVLEVFILGRAGYKGLVEGKRCLIRVIRGLVWAIRCLVWGERCLVRVIRGLVEGASGFSRCCVEFRV